MSQFFSRRQFLKYSGLGILTLAGYRLLSLNKQGSRANPAPDSTLADLEKRIPILMEQALVPGLTLALIKEGQLYYSRGFGVKKYKSQERVEPETIFAAASLTKPMFAYAVLKLCEQGLLNLDTPLTEYTAKPYLKDPRIQQITARMVLSHTTGFPNWSGNSPLWIERTPGTKFGYSGEGYLYLQQVVETVTGEPLGDYMKRNFLIPWGMGESSLVWEPNYNSLASYGHDRQGTPKAMSKPQKALSAGSLRTTAADYAQFLLAMMNDTGTPESAFLTPSSIQVMVKPQINISSSLAWGLGWGIEKTQTGDYFWHWGDVNTFKSFTVASLSQKTAIVILTNSQNGLKICPEIVSIAIGGQHPAFKFSMISY